MMKIYEGGVSKDSLKLFVSDIGCEEFFSYVGNLVSLEQAISVLGLLSPDFIELEGHVFWLPNAQQYEPQKFHLKGLVETEAGGFKPSGLRKDVERYKNIFTINQFFSKWEGAPNRPVYKVGLSEEDYRLCYLFAEQIARYWARALLDCFPEKKLSSKLLTIFLMSMGFVSRSGRSSFNLRAKKSGWATIFYLQFDSLVSLK